MSVRTLEERFWSRVDRSAGSDSCWPWTAAKSNIGYGHLRDGSKVRNTHKLSYEMHFGTVPDGMFVCHSCDNPPCVNPAHLWLGTNADNMRDMREKGRQYRPPRVIRPPKGEPRYERGESRRQSKLTEEAVREIRSSAESQSTLARQYGVTQSLISVVKSGRRWRHVA